MTCAKAQEARLWVVGGACALFIALGIGSHPANGQTLRSGSQAAPAPPLQLGIAVSGVITAIPVADGAHVDARQVLLQVGCRPLQFQVEARTSGLAADEAAYERTRNGPRPDEIAIAEAAVGVARARSDEASDEYDRLARLRIGTTVTQEQVFRAEREARIAAAQLDDAAKRLALLRAGSRVEDIAEAQSRRDEAEARLQEAKAALDECSIRAPVAGVVTVNATLGQFVSKAVPTVLIRLTPDAAHR